MCDTSLSAERAVPRRAVDDVGRLAMLFENFELLRTIVPFFRVHVQLQALYSAENPHSSECLACVPESHSVQLLLTRNCTLSFRKITRGFTVSPTVYSVGFSAPSRRRRRSDVGSLANGEGAAFLLPPLLHGRELTCAAGVCLAGECQDGRYDRGYGEGRNRACLLCDE